MKSLLLSYEQISGDSGVTNAEKEKDLNKVRAKMRMNYYNLAMFNFIPGIQIKVYSHRKNENQQRSFQIKSVNFNENSFHIFNLFSTKAQSEI